MTDNIDPLLLEQIKLYAFSLSLALIKVIIIFIVGRIAVHFTMKAVTRIFEKYKVDVSLAGFLTTFLRTVLYIALVLIILQSLDIKIAAVLGVLGAAGLAIGLALQGSLANFAGGILILVFKPFRVNDVIDTANVLGTVERIDILHTHVRTFDNRLVIMPNGALANSNVINMTAKDTRRVELALGVAYGSDLQRVREIVLDVFAADERVLSDPEPVVRFVKFGESSLDLTARCWSATGDLWPVYWDCMEAINNAFVREGIEIPFPQRTVHMRSK